MEKYIKMREGFEYSFEETANKVNVLGLSYNDIEVAKGWMEITDFVAVLESGLRNKLGTNKNYSIGDYTVISGRFENQFLVYIEISEEVLILDSVELQQLVSKLNKLLHTANKLASAKFRR